MCRIVKYAKVMWNVYRVHSIFCLTNNNCRRTSGRVFPHYYTSESTTARSSHQCSHLKYFTDVTFISALL